MRATPTPHPSAPHPRSSGTPPGTGTAHLWEHRLPPRPGPALPTCNARPQRLPAGPALTEALFRGAEGLKAPKEAPSVRLAWTKNNPRSPLHLRSRSPPLRRNSHLYPARPSPSSRSDVITHRPLRHRRCPLPRWRRRRQAACGVRAGGCGGAARVRGRGERWGGGARARVGPRAWPCVGRGRGWAGQGEVKGSGAVPQGGAVELRGLPA